MKVEETEWRGTLEVCGYSIAAEDSGSSPNDTASEVRRPESSVRNFLIFTLYHYR